MTNGTYKMPFATRSAWLSLQSNCADLCQSHTHLKQGTYPSKKLTNIKDTKRYLQYCTISKDALLVVIHRAPFSPLQETIVVPHYVLPGLLTALHVKLPIIDNSNANKSSPAFSLPLTTTHHYASSMTHAIPISPCGR